MRTSMNTQTTWRMRSPSKPYKRACTIVQVLFFTEVLSKQGRHATTIYHYNYEQIVNKYMNKLLTNCKFCSYFSVVHFAYFSLKYAFFFCAVFFGSPRCDFVCFFFFKILNTFV